MRQTEWSERGGIMESADRIRIKRMFFPGFSLGTRARSRIRKFLLEGSGICTLDLGCGNGHFTAMAARRGGSALGVSFDANQIARCNQFKPYLGVEPSRLEFRVMNASEIESLDERFDQVLMLEVIEHIDNDGEVLKKIAALLKPGGVLQLTTPDIRWGHWTATLDRFQSGGHVRLGYTARRLEELVRAAGLDVAFQSKFCGLGNFLVRVQRGIIRLLGGSLTAEGIAFLLVYPAYLALNLVPIPNSLRMSQFIQARKRMEKTEGAELEMALAASEAGGEMA